MATMTIQATYDSSTVPHYVQWGQMLGQALTQFGWVPQTGHGEIVNNGLTGTSYAWSNIVAGPGTTALAPAANYNFQGAWVSGNTYVGGNTAGGSNYDVVTSSGLTYVHITATSSLATAPAADTTNWAPFNFEIWKTNGPLSSGAPYYLKICYVQNATTTGTPAMHITLGKGVDVNGNVYQAFQFSNNTPVTTIRANSTQAISTTLWNNNFSGDADNFRFVLYQNFGTNSTNVFTFSFDRGYNSAGTQIDAFATLYHMLPIAGSLTPQSCLQFKNALGGANFNYDSTRWSGSLSWTGSSMSNMGAILAAPVFPLMGFVGAPTLGVVTFPQSDVVDSSIQPVWQYGATHLYLVVRNIPNAASPNGTNAASCPGILWE
jgi:hypothetical protein